MKDGYEAVLRLTGEAMPSTQRRQALRAFAEVNGWRPSDEIDEYPGTTHIANGHLLIEHGLDNAAVITFLKEKHPFARLDTQQQHQLLSISYNHLVEWHIFPDVLGITLVFNRTDPLMPRRILREAEPDTWRADAFDRITGRRPSPNLKMLDDALISTLSTWKRLIAAELGNAVGNAHISALFNSILLFRALEDHKRLENGPTEPVLLTAWKRLSSRSRTFRSCLRNALKLLKVPRPPSYLIDTEGLKAFDSLETATVEAMLRDFYTNRFAPYEYDFSLMSKHALSRVYERYVSLLRNRASDQMLLFRDLPEEYANRSMGGVYTPQYVARFFARFLKENLTPRHFRSLQSMDPACGSGMFLRTLLEYQCDPLQDISMRTPTQAAFAGVYGIDIDENACQATRLSLALLHLVLTDGFPRTLNIINEEAIDHFRRESRTLRGSFDVVRVSSKKVGSP